MANGKISFTNTAGNPEDYSFVKNFDWNYTNDLEVNKTVNNSQSGVIKVTKIFERQVFKISFNAILTAQKDKLLEIKSAMVGTFYYDADLTGYYGLMEFSEPIGIASGYWNIDMTFKESTETVPTFASINVKVVNNETTAYSDVVFSFPVDTATLISAGTLDSDGYYLRILDGNGIALNFWYQTETWNSAATIFWVRIASVTADQTFYVQLLLDSTRTSALASGTSTFDYFEDFTGLNLGTIVAQDTWLKNGAGTEEIVVYSGKKMLHIDDTSGFAQLALSRNYAEKGGAGNDIVLTRFYYANPSGSLKVGFSNGTYVAGAGVGGGAPEDGYTGVTYQTLPATSKIRAMKYDNYVKSCIFNIDSTDGYYTGAWKVLKYRWYGTNHYTTWNGGTETAVDATHAGLAHISIEAEALGEHYIDYLCYAITPKTEFTTTVFGE